MILLEVRRAVTHPGGGREWKGIRGEFLGAVHLLFFDVVVGTCVSSL